MALAPANSHGAGQPLNLPGAAAASRYVGGTTSGAPVSGTFVVGDFVIGQDGTLYICTAAGSPGTWVAVSGSSSSADGWTAAGETWTYASADAPTFTFTVAADVTTKYAVGQRIKLTQTTAKYFLVTAVSTFSGGNTTITIYGGTDYTLANAAITLPFWSMAKAPFGFPQDPAKWTVKVTDTSQRQQLTPAQNTWYNLGSITISVPIGAWNVDYFVDVYMTDATVSGWTTCTTLSTANNSESDAEFTTQYYTSSQAGYTHTLYRGKQLAVAAKTSYFLNARTTNSGLDQINFLSTSGNGPCVIRAICAYL